MAGVHGGPNGVPAANLPSQRERFGPKGMPNCALLVSTSFYALYRGAKRLNDYLFCEAPTHKTCISIWGTCLECKQCVCSGLIRTRGMAGVE